jgi:transcriptional regulator with XRE-family HTH domain
MRLSDFLTETQTKPAVFARQLGVAHTTVMRWASGDVSPSLDAMERIAKATEGRVMPNDFMRFDATPADAAA